MRKKLSCAVAAAMAMSAGAVAIGVGPSGAGASTFSITAWGLPNGAAGGDSGPVNGGVAGFGGPSVNSAGVGVGSGQVGETPNIQALSFGSGALTLLPALGATNIDSYAMSINSSNTIVGFQLESGTTPSTQSLEWSGGLTKVLDVDHYTEAYANNDAGTAVGARLSPDGSSLQPEEFNSPGVFTLLGNIANPSTPSDTYADGISNDGVIIGNAVNSSGLSVGLTFPGSAATPLPLPSGDAQSLVTSVSRSNDFIAGAVAPADSHLPTAALWHGTSSVPTVLGLLPATTESAALGVNSAGTAVGFSGTPTTSPTAITTTAAMWIDGTVINLNSYLPLNSGWQLYQADGISDTNIIVGQGIYNGQHEGFTMQLPTLLGGKTVLLPLLELPPLLHLPIYYLPIIGQPVNMTLNSLLGL